MCDVPVFRSGQRVDDERTAGMSREFPKAALERSLLSRHTQSSSLSHFEGSEEELKNLVSLAWLYLERKPSTKPDKQPHTFLLRGVNPTNFFCKDQATKTIHGMVKVQAETVDFVIRISRFNGSEAEEIELVDFQAWPWSPTKAVGRAA